MLKKPSGLEQKNLEARLFNKQQRNNNMKRAIFVALIILFSSTSFFAQLKLGADIYSRYIWRGLKAGGDSPSLQPSLSYSTGGFTAGLWGAYSYPGDSAVYSEIDMYLSYSLCTEHSGSFGLVATDYYIPSLSIPFGYYQDNGGAHVIEGGLTYSGPEIFPIFISGYLNFYNDPDNSVYIQAGYPFTIEDATLSLAAAFVPAKSAYYLTDKAAFINLSITAAKTIPITDKFEIPINVAYIINPNQDVGYLVLGAGFTF
jgi:hypothetical protein